MKLNNSKKQKGGKDIISRLPDDVLIHILSRLETVHAVRTCILSSRWKNLWKSIYNLDFKFGFGRVEKHISFINRVLSLLQSKDIRGFHLNFVLSNLELGHIGKWVHYAAERNVGELTLNIYYDYMGCIKWPQSIFTCKSLVKLTVHYLHFGYDIPNSVVCFPSLKSLYITVCVCSDNPADQMLKLFHSCPVLEDLTIDGMIDCNVKTFEITLPTLRTLNIYGDTCDIGFYSAPNKFVVKAHNLEFLNIHGKDTFSFFVFGETPFLSKVALVSKIRDIPKYVSKNEGNQTMEFLTGIKNTRSLSLSIPASRVLSFAFDGNLPSFTNLIHLELGIESCFGWKLLPHFLTNSPNLQVLNLKQDHKEFELDERLGLDDFVWFELESVPSCLLLHVKRIQIKNMVGEYDELEVIKYLLKNSKVLESFLVQIKIPNFQRAEKIRKLVLKFPRGSTLCEIKFL